MNVAEVIPARYQLNRFPSKLIANICEETMIWGVV